MKQGFNFSQDEYISVLRNIHREIRHFRFGTKETDLPALIEKPFSVQNEHLLPILDRMVREKLVMEYSCDSDKIHKRINSAKALGFDYGLIEPPIEWDIAVWVATGFLKHTNDLLAANVPQDTDELLDDMVPERNGKKSVVTFSDEFGIFIDGDKSASYSIERGSGRYYILRILKENPGLQLNQIQERLPERVKFKGSLEQTRNSVFRAIKEMNRLFKSDALGKFDLIIPIDTGGRQLNKADYIFKIDDSGL